MNRLKLDLTALAVDSFDTSLAAGKETGRGWQWAWSDNSVCPGTTTTRPPYAH